MDEAPLSLQLLLAHLYALGRCHAQIRCRAEVLEEHARETVPVAVQKRIALLLRH